MSASKYAFIGGFDGTSNVLAGVLNNIPIKGTHAHSFVSSFPSLEALNKAKINSLSPKQGDETKNNAPDSPGVGKHGRNFIAGCLHYRSLLKGGPATNEGELAAFISYAYAFPNGFLALVDTYSTIESGTVNFMAVALCLHLDFGYKPIGIRLDSGDLAYLSKYCRQYFIECSVKFGVEQFKKLTIVASNDIHEEVLYSLNAQKHEIDAFGIGTHLVTCKRQPALGCVYKLVEIGGEPRIKVSQSVSKMTIPGRKYAYRLYSENNEAILDLMTLEKLVINGNGVQGDEIVNVNGDSKQGEKSVRILCEHPFDFSKRCYVTPKKIEPLLNIVWDGKAKYDFLSLTEVQNYCRSKVQTFREDYLRHTNPTPYKVSVSSSLRTTIQDLYQKEMPIVDYK